MSGRLARLGFWIAALAAWQLLAMRGAPDYVLAPADIVKHFVAALGTRELYADAGASLLRALPGFAIGTLLGIALGLAAGIRRAFDELLSPLVFLTYPVPKIVMLPLFMLWFGIGDLSTLILIALALAAWEITARSGVRSPILFPPLERIGAQLWLFVSRPEGFTQSWTTLYRAFGGFALAAVAGVVLGMLMGRSSFVAALL